MKKYDVRSLVLNVYKNHGYNLIQNGDEYKFSNQSVAIGEISEIVVKDWTDGRLQLTVSRKTSSGSWACVWQTLKKEISYATKRSYETKVENSLIIQNSYKSYFECEKKLAEVGPLVNMTLREHGFVDNSVSDNRSVNIKIGDRHIYVDILSFANSTFLSTFEQDLKAATDLVADLKFRLEILNKETNNGE